jgi:hypothetical protein
MTELDEVSIKPASLTQPHFWEVIAVTPPRSLEGSFDLSRKCHLEDKSDLLESIQQRSANALGAGDSVGHIAGVELAQFAQTRRHDFYLCPGTAQQGPCSRFQHR